MPTITEQLTAIKRSFRPYMNGIAAQSMRDRGLHYHVIWGVALPDLQQLAKEYTPDADLAMALWKEDVRECKIMALLLMPHRQADDDTVDLMLEQMPTQEMAELAAFFLFQYIKDAPQKALRWITSGAMLTSLCGYHVLTRCMKRGIQLTAEEKNTLSSQAQACRDDAENKPLACRMAADNCLSVLNH